MPHPLSFPSPIKDSLFSGSFGVLTPTVEFKIRTKTVTAGVPSAIATDETVTMTSRLSDKKRLSFTIKKPILPRKSEGLTAGRITLNLVNSDEQWSVEQIGSLIDAANYDQGTVRLSANINGTPFIIARGKLEGSPTEQFGFTGFNARDSLWDVISKPVVWEKFGTVLGSNQNSYILGTNTFINEFVTIEDTSSILTPLIGKYFSYDGYTTFAEDGRIITTVTNNKVENIVLLNINVLNRALPGEYVIRFESETNYTLTHPDNSETNGTILADMLSSPYIEIRARYWRSLTAERGKGAEIKFKIVYNAAGNGIAIIMNLLEKAMLDNWGALPGWGRTGPSVGLAVDWPAFWTMARQYRRYAVYVSRTNQSNDLWQQIKGKRPFNCLDLCNEIANHYGLFLTLDIDGQITIKDRKIFDEDVFTLTDSNGIMDGFKLTGQSAGNFMIIQYGHNLNSETFGAESTVDLRDDSADQKEVITFQYPYFKAGISDNKILSMANYLTDRVKDSKSVASAKVTPNFIVPAVPGDRHNVITAVQPRLNSFFEVVSITKNALASGFTDGQMKLVKIQPPAGRRSFFCEYTVGDRVVS